MPDMPEWVQVWAWLRFAREPQCMTALPHQGINPEAMTMEEFDEFQQEWVEAGRPSIKPKDLVAVMAGAVVADDEDIPF